MWLVRLNARNRTTDSTVNKNQIKETQTSTFYFGKIA